MEWVNMIIVYGDKEKVSGKFPVRLRSGEQKMMTLEELKAEIVRLSKGYPKGGCPCRHCCPKRPVFRG